jgi:hypothetical protein
MKQLIVLLFILCSSAALSAQTISLSEPVAKDASSETYGEVLNNALKEVSISDLASDSAQYLNTPFTLKTRIAKVCQKKGCFFIAQQNEHVFRVSFKDYGFFIPTDSSGKTVLLNGELIQKEISEEQAAHFSADLQAEAGEIAHGAVYEIVATSVKIPLS